MVWIVFGVLLVLAVVGAAIHARRHNEDDDYDRRLW